MLANDQGKTFSATDRNLRSGAENKYLRFLCDNFQIITASAFFTIRRTVIREAKSLQEGGAERAQHMDKSLQEGGAECAQHMDKSLQEGGAERAQHMDKSHQEGGAERAQHMDNLSHKKSNKMRPCIKTLFHIYMKLNMFRAKHRPSSGA